MGSQSAANRYVGISEVYLAESQRDLLRFGLATASAWRDIHLPDIAREIDIPLPQWYNETLFQQQMASHIELLRQYIDVVMAYRAERNAANRQLVINVLSNVVNEFEFTSAVLEAIRADETLIGHDVYQLLWPSPQPQGAPTGTSPTPVMAPANRPPDAAIASSFLSFVHSQQELVTRSYTEADARRELLDRFERFLGRALGVTSAADQAISERPGTANAPPFPAILGVSPPLSGPPGGPQFEASAEADYRFVMSIQFPDVFSAFTCYYFEWNYVRVPDEQIGRPAAFEELNPEEPSRLDVARRRFSRAGRYAIEDVETMVSELGPAGVSALTLVAANAILRFIGTGIRLGIELLTMPSGERSIAFPGPGVYVVRNKAIPYTGEKAELVRPPSVAYQPVIVRDPVELVEERARQDAAVAERDFARMEELRELLSEPLSHLGEEQMREELSILERSLSSLGSSLDVQREQLIRYRDSLPEGSKEREQAERQLDRLYEIFMVRAGRAEDHDLSGAQPLIASFIGDTGQSIRLSMEAVYEGERDGEMIYWVSDLTTPDSSQGTCTGSSRSEAIMNAVESILRGQGGYGRGHVAVNIDGITYTRRITASLGSLFEEALVNITLALSVAVVVAAPFTNFATLVLLLPIGAVGAIPSAYRIINRAIDDTLRFDMATVMDIVNIVGGLAGLGHAVTPLRMVNVGRAFMIAGLGADGLGMLLIPVGVVAQIMDLPEGMTPGERSAQIMEILGQAMLNVGIMAGGALAQRARQQRMEAHGQVTTPEPAPRPGVPETETPGGRVSTRWEELLTPETRRILEADPELRRLYAEMNPEVRRLLTLCASVCIPTDPKPSAEDIQRIQALLNRLNLPGDHAGLREYLHVRRRELTRAVDDIADVADLTELQARLDRAIAERATTAGAAASRGANGLWEYRRSDGLVVWEHELASYGHQASSRQTRGFFQSHHGIQDAWARERVPGYERGKGEAILLRDSRSGTPHQIVTSRQSGRAAGIEGRTYSQERQLMLEDMAGADVPSSTAQRLLANADAYFAELYRVLARSEMNEEALRSIFGNWRP